MAKIYKEANKCETETTINVLYSENILSIYTNKVDLERRLHKRTLCISKSLGNTTR